MSVQKTKLDVLSLMALAVMAGAFIILGAMFATTVLAGADGVLPFGLSRLFAGIAFCLGPILVIVEKPLFTANALMVMAWAAARSNCARCCVLGSSFTSAILLARTAGTAMLVFFGAVSDRARHRCWCYPQARTRQGNRAIRARSSSHIYAKSPACAWRCRCPRRPNNNRCLRCFSSVGLRRCWF